VFGAYMQRSNYRKRSKTSRDGVRAAAESSLATVVVYITYDDSQRHEAVVVK
jgi:hypothetical protein